MYLFIEFLIRGCLYIESFAILVTPGSTCFPKQIIHMARGNQTKNRKSRSYRRAKYEFYMSSFGELDQTNTDKDSIILANGGVSSHNELRIHSSFT